MTATWKIAVVISLFEALRYASGYHSVANAFFDCWPLNATSASTDTIACGELRMDWLNGGPPDQIEVGVRLNVSYHATILSYSPTPVPFQGFNMNATQLKQFCENQTCNTLSGMTPTKSDCAVWHANVHTCHPGVTLCGPWIANGSLATHTETEYGSIKTVFTSYVVLTDLGSNFIIAHLKIGSIQIALGKPVVGIRPRVCGDNICSPIIGETCSTCPMDCCLSSSSIAGIAVSVIVAVLLITVIISVSIGVCYVYYQRWKIVVDDSWIIDYNDIQRDPGYKGVMGSISSMRRHSTAENESCGTVSTSAVIPSVNSAHRKQLFTQTGIYDGRIVAIKRFPKRDFVFNKSVREEVTQIRMLDNPNLCKFIGAVVRDPVIVAVVSEYCPKGSLNDVLQNDDIPLNWGFRLSFAYDIAQAMAYLHSKKVYHGHLKSSNCVIDDRWVVKISDYGLGSFRILECDPQGGFTNDTACTIYTPPELRGKIASLPLPTTDVYGYAIILLEIATRMDPYSEDTMQDSARRPMLNVQELNANNCPCSQEYLELTERCWMFLPASRPTFDQIRKTIYRINPNKESPVDNMMVMMEKYSKHLELLVAERTQELIAEQHKTAALLYSMIPKSVADELKQGKTTSATSFPNATVFFCDIVGFTSLASSSTPLQIVGMLNELYSKFDDILDHYDTYKVETIGDSYMVVSGVPKQNGNNHAGEIAKMALELVESCRSFKIPHRPSTTLEIRAGVHSGPVCAGVVGLKMPRYCLFGDTVNTASRMETTSEAMKIQCSDSTAQLLKILGGFQLECRGNISVKGKGAMLTWWIVGADDGTDSLCSANLQSNLKPKTMSQRSKEDGVKRILSPLQSLNNKFFEADQQLPGSVSTDIL
eukprot:Em0011g518a